MTLVVPNVGEVQLLTDLLNNGENWTLKLFKNDVTPGESSVLSDFVEADFTNYGAQTLTRQVGTGKWSTPATTDGITSSTYNAGTPQSWTCGTSGNTIYGYYVVGATSGVLIYAERFATPRTLADGDTLHLTPKIELA